jgi:hypothetical protein
MKKLFIIVSLILLSGSIAAKDIQYVDMKQGYYFLYDAESSSPKTISCNNGDLVGYSKEMCVLYKDGYYKMYNAEGRFIGSISKGKIGSVQRIVGSTLVARKDGYVSIWDSKGRLISERSVR